MTASRLPLAAAAISVLLWASAYVVSGLVLASASPAVLSIGRFVLAIPLLLAVIAVRRRDPRRAGLLTTLRRPRTVLLGLLGVTLYYAPTNLSLLITTPGTAALLSAALPVFTALGAALLLHERLTRRTVAGIVAATVGVGLVVADGFTVDLGIGLALVGVVAYAGYTVLLRRFAQPPVGLGPTPDTAAITLPTVESPTDPPPAARAPDALVLATATAIWGTTLMLPWLGVEAALGSFALPAGTTGWGGILYLAIAVTAPTLVLFNYAAERLPAAISGIAVAGIPVLGYALALPFGEPLTVAKVVGGLVALAGIVVATSPAGAVRPSRRRPPVRDDLSPGA